MDEPQGFLAIWSDVSGGDRTDYLHWLTREHIEERLSVPGFLSARVFCARRDDVNRYFILYDLREPGVVGSAPYLERLNSPKPWSQRIMTRITNFKRGGGKVVSRSGFGMGGLALPVVAAKEAAPAWSAPRPDLVCRISVLATDLGQTTIATAEKKLRGGDDSFAGLTVLEGFDEAALLRTAADAIAPEIYELIFVK